MKPLLITASLALALSGAGHAADRDIPHPRVIAFGANASSAWAPNYLEIANADDDSADPTTIRFRVKVPGRYVLSFSATCNSDETHDGFDAYAAFEVQVNGNPTPPSASLRRYCRSDWNTQSREQESVALTTAVWLVKGLNIVRVQVTRGTMINPSIVIF